MTATAAERYRDQALKCLASRIGQVRAEEFTAVAEGIDHDVVNVAEAMAAAYEEGRRSVIDGYQQYGMVTDRNGECGTSAP
jgi:hypothetical protein